nr:hypothetical protein [uncultured Oscillibacter sp.]
MLILGNAAFGHMETGDEGKYLVPGQPDSTWSVAVMLDFQNDSEKTIQSAAFSFLPYGASGCTASCEAGGRPEARLRLTGAIEPNEIRRQVYWENVWRSRGISHVKLVKIEITYTDGSMETLRGRQIHYAIA